MYFGPFLMDLLSRANEEFWNVPDRVLYQNIRIEPEDKLTIEIFTSSQESLGNRNPTGMMQRGDFLYIVKAEVEELEDAVRNDFTATTTQRIFEPTELTDQGEKEIPIRNDKKIIQYIAVLIEKYANQNWVPLLETDDFGELVITIGGQIALIEDYVTLRTLTYSNLRYKGSIPAGIIIHRLLPRSFPYELIFDENYGINARDVKISVKGRRGNEIKYRFTVSVLAYDQFSKISQ